MKCNNGFGRAAFDLKFLLGASHKSKLGESVLGHHAIGLEAITLPKSQHHAITPRGHHASPSRRLEAGRKELGWRLAGAKMLGLGC